MAEQTHKVEIVKIQIEPHPNADRLDVARIFGFTCCVAKDQFPDGAAAELMQMFRDFRAEFDAEVAERPSDAD